MKVCAVNGCQAKLWSGNSTGVCRSHNHFEGVCECHQCRGKSALTAGAKKPPELSVEQCFELRAMVRAGFGYEDFAVLTGVPVMAARAEFLAAQSAGAFGARS